LIYLLDTDTCVYAIKREPQVLGRLQEHGPEAKSSRPRQTLSSVNTFLMPFEILPFGREAAGDYAETRLQLERAGQTIGERDLLIAATAKARRLAVVTHNVREFSRVSGLEVEDWR